MTTKVTTKVPELKSISRGKKRDRTEAGSTFGGDDEDSVHEAEIEDDIKLAGADATGTVGKTEVAMQVALYVAKSGTAT